MDLIFDVCEAQRRRALDTAALEAMLETPKQRQALSKLRAALLDDEPVAARDTATLIRFLRARDFNLKKAEKMLRDMLAWRRDFIPEGGFPMDAADIEEEAVRVEIAKGKMFYADGHYDLDGRLIFVVRSYLFEKENNLDACLKALVWLLEFGRRTKRHPLEKVTCVWDYTGGSLGWDGYMKQFVDTLQNYYPEGLKACILCPIGGFFWFTWKVVQWFMNEVTRKKLCFLAEGEYDRMLEYVAKEDLPLELGGDVEVDIPECRRKFAFPVLDADRVAAAAEEKKRRQQSLWPALE